MLSRLGTEGGELTFKHTILRTLALRDTFVNICIELKSNNKLIWLWLTQDSYRWEIS